MKYIIESEKKIEVRADYDVVVAGGGFAGVAAAVSAARMGANVLLIEREYMLGGLGTLGLITIYEPIDDGLGHQVAFSMAEELLRLSIKHGWEGDYCDAWLEDKPYEAKRDQRFRVRFNANVCAILMEQLLLESGVKLLYGTTVSAVHMEGDKIKALIVENKAGRYAVGCKTVVDVTGDADIVKYACGKTARFGPGNILACWHYEFVDNEFLIRKKGAAEIQGKKPAEGEANKVKRYSGIEDLTDIAIDAHESILEYFLKNGNVTPRHALTAVATIPQVRMTRRICGEYTMDISEVHKRFEDSIGMCGNWRKTEDVRG